jgi:long-chain fatty acid transport protein
MKTLRTSLFAALGLGALTSIAAANAFNINEHDARVTGRGGAAAASNEEPSSIFLNVGGMAKAEGTNILIGSSLYIAEGYYQTAAGKTETDSDPALVPSLYVTSRVHEMVAVGIGFHMPFGLSESWPEDHQQSDILQDETLRTYYITPAIGLNLDRYVPGLSLGVGLDIVPTTIELENTITFGDVEGRAHLGGDDIGIGFRAGVMYHPPAVPTLKLGVQYRSKVKLDFEGEGDFDIIEPLRGQLPPDGDIAASITLPQAVWGGVAYTPVRNLEVELDAVWIDWGQTWENGELRISLPGGLETAERQDYESTVTYRFGADYALPDYKAAVRAGFIYDPTPIQRTTLTARLPDINRKNITVGGSRQFGDYGVHLGFLWVTPGTRETSDIPNEPQIKATYGVQAFVLALSLTGTFGGPAEPAPAGEPSVAKK